VASVAQQGSMAAAARTLGLVPSALTYRIRRIEDGLDVLLFDRSSRRSAITPAGEELLRGGERLRTEMSALANRVKRVATGWEPELTIASDAIISSATLLALCSDFYALNAPTRLRLRQEVLSGTWQSLLTGQTDLAIGVVIDEAHQDIETAHLGSIPFVFAVAPGHPLAGVRRALTDQQLGEHRAVAVADSASRGGGVTHRLLAGQEVLTVPTMAMKLQAQLAGIGCGYLPEPLARSHLDRGELVAVPVKRRPDPVGACYAWRKSLGDSHGKAMQWWLNRLGDPVTRAALFDIA
jgi:DNA-binding transcriptional LysR family regulator